MRGYMIAGSIILGAIEGGFRFAGNNFDSNETSGISRIWSELRAIDATLSELRGDMKVLQEAEKQNLRRDTELTTLENRLGAVEIEAAKTEARLPKG